LRLERPEVCADATEAGLSIALAQQWYATATNGIFCGKIWQLTFNAEHATICLP